MKLARTARWVSCAIVAGASVAAAQGTVVGRVTAAGSGEPLANAHVIAVGTNSSAITTLDGRYTLKHLAPGSVDVEVLHVGYRAQKKTATVPASGSADADFSLSLAVAKLAEVVTTATGEQRTVELGHTTTALTDVGTRMEESPTTYTIGDLLTQRVPSLSVLGQGMIATASSIRLRGLNSLSQSNEPIVLVDGVRVTSSNLTPGAGVGGTQTSFLTSFTPEEIETIEVVKGPAAATVYGTNAANGVILVTTKKGRVGGARWTWTSEQGGIVDNNDYPSTYAIWGHAPATPATQIRCLLATMSATTCVQDSSTSLNVFDNSALTPLHTGRRSLYGMQVSGGTDAVRFYISGNIENALGPIEMPEFSKHRLDSMRLASQIVAVRGEWTNPEALQRENFRANMNATLTPNLELGINAAFIKSDQRFPQSDNSPVGLFGAARQGPGFAHAGLGYSNRGALNEDLNGYNLWVPSEMFQDLSTQDVQREALSSNLSWRHNAWLQHDVVAGLDYATVNDFNVCRLNECAAFSTLRNGSNLSRTAGTRVMNIKESSVATWNARPDLNIKTTVGTEYAYLEGDVSQAVGVGLPPGAQNVGQAAARTAATNQSATVGKTLGLFAQGQAALRDRLFFTLGLRGDQNSAFGEDNQWAFYPKAGVSWLLSDEPRFPKRSWLDQFRARVAYGVSGLQPGLTAGRRTFQPITASVKGADAQGLIGSQLGNPAIKPERVGEFETGFDVRLLNNRVGFEATYFNKTTTDAIVQLPIAASTGSGALFNSINAGSLSNSGFEGLLTTQLVDLKQVAWDVTLAASHGTSRVLKTGPVGPILNGANTYLVSGLPINALLFRTYTYADANADGRIQSTEVTVDTALQSFGNQLPRDLISLQNGVDLFSRRLRLTALLDYKGGYSVLDASSAYLCSQFLSCADESNPNASLADQARSVANRYGTVVNGTTFTTPAGYLSNGRFWRLRELAATVALPNVVTKRVMRSDRASINVSARNLHVWSSYRGVDPESSFGGGDLQTDFLTAGPPTFYTVRLNLHY